MNPIVKSFQVLRHLGPRFVWQRLSLSAARRFGGTKRIFRPRPWNEIELYSILQSNVPTDLKDYARFKQESPPPFLFPLGEPPAIPDAIRTAQTNRTPNLQERLNLLAEDRCVYFLSMPSPEPIDWEANPFDGARARGNRPWYEIPDFDPRQGDPRMLWEPSRAAWAIDLARARAHGIDVDAGYLFWRFVDAWMDPCPPFLGFQWKCGQESSVRMIALALGFWSLAADPETTHHRWRTFARLAWATGYRVFHHIRYAVSQKNNHALSEACGLLLIAHLFPEFRAAKKWGATGRHILAREMRRQIYDDGSYVQHSMNYHRIMLHTCLLALRLGELAGRPFPRDLYDRLQKAGDFLHAMIDPETGRVPDYGHNDGAMVLPLSECGLDDFRPAVQAVGYLTRRERVLPPGPWDEDLLWLFGAEALAPHDDAAEIKPTKRSSCSFESGGYYTLARPDSWAMIRCHTYRDRPSQYDPLHLDLWWKGLNVLRDCGTFRYYVPGRSDVEFYFKSAAAHNTVEIDGRTPSELVSRFLWLPWPRARRRHFQPRGRGAVWFEGEQYDYDRGPRRILHRRTVIALANDVWMIVDDLLGRGDHTATLRWHLLDSPYETRPDDGTVILDTTKGKMTIRVQGRPTSPDRFEVIRGRDEPGQVQGFASPHYGKREPIPTIEAEVSFSWPQRLVTCICPGDDAVIRVVEQDDATEQWEIGPPDDTWIIDLARPSRESTSTLIRESAGVPSFAQRRVGD